MAALKQNWVKLIFLLGIFLVATSLLYRENYRNIALVAFATAGFFSLFFKSCLPKPSLKPLIYNAAFFIIMLSSLLYTDNFDYAEKRITVMIGLVIIPLSFYFFESNQTLNYDKLKHQFYALFFISTVIFFIGVFIQNYFNDHFNEFIFRDYSERLNSRYGKYSMHPIYASIFLSLALIFTVPLYSKLRKIWHKTVLLLAALFLASILALLTRKGIIAITFLIFLIYFIRNQNRKNLLYLGLFATILFIVSYNIPALKTRYVELFNTLFNDSLTSLGSTSLRIEVYHCVFEGIKQSPIIGYGIGDTKEILMSCYSQSPEIFNGKYYNSHNQFLSAWLVSGLAGVGSLIAMLVFNFRMAIQNKDFVHIAGLVVLFTTLFTENILERQNGVILFSFFVNFFAFSRMSEKGQ